MKKKLLVLCLCIILIAITIVFGTMAYFTDTDYSDVQTVVVGEVKIRLLDTGRDIETLVEDDVIMPGDSWEKTLTVENVGKTSAYTRIILRVPAEVNRLFCFRLSDQVAFTEGDDPSGAMRPAGQTAESPAFKYSYSTVTEEGKTYVLHTFTQYAILPVGAVTESPVAEMLLRPELDHVDFEDVELTMTFLAHAIQASDLFTDVDEAFVAFGDQILLDGA